MRNGRRNSLLWEPRRHKRWIRWLAAPLVIGAVVGACGEDPNTGIEPRAEEVALRVVVGGEVAFDWTLADLEAATTFTTMNIDGDEQNGPLLLDVLAASGIESWDTAQVLGFGEGRTFEVSLDISGSQVDEGWVLDITNKGTLKLAADDLPRAEWVRDVGEIRLP